MWPKIAVKFGFVRSFEFLNTKTPPVTLAFTICSINYLAQATTLGKSLTDTNPGWRFIIGLVDRLDGVEIDADKLPAFPMLEIDKIDIDGLDWMCQNYDITELNTAVKPFFFKHFYATMPQVENVIYFDPDIIVYQPLDELLQDVAAHSLVVTPHITQPIDDDKMPNEAILSATGIFNLGFIATRRHPQTMEFVGWWAEKLKRQCLIALEDGLFVDQKWVVMAPTYFEDVSINKYVGYNVAYWNLHERIVSRRDGVWFVNETDPLRFFHFSGYGLKKPAEISKYQTRYSFDSRPDVRPVFEDYAQRLTDNHNAYFSTFRCFYVKPPKRIYYKSVRNLLARPLYKLIQLLD